MFSYSVQLQQFVSPFASPMLSISFLSTVQSTVFILWPLMIIWLYNICGEDLRKTTMLPNQFHSQFRKYSSMLTWALKQICFLLTAWSTTFNHMHSQLIINGIRNMYKKKKTLHYHSLIPQNPPCQKQNNPVNVNTPFSARLQAKSSEIKRAELSKCMHRPLFHLP